MSGSTGASAAIVDGQLDDDLLACCGKEEQ
jgi:hypothetical protein